MPILLEQILEMPNAALLAEQVQTALRAEQDKRQHFYEIIDEQQRMEFINGEIYFDSPAKFRHTKTIGLLFQLISVFVSKHQYGFVGTEKMLISLTRNDYEPDICFFEKAKSQAFTPTQMQFPAPDLIVEVLSDSTAEKDRTTKYADYAAHGVSEYWIIDPEKEIVEQYFLQNNKYELLLKSNNGEIRSVILPSFAIPVRAIFDEQVNLEALTNILRDV